MSSEVGTDSGETVHVMLYARCPQHLREWCPQHPLTHRCRSRLGGASLTSTMAGPRESPTPGAFSCPPRGRRRSSSPCSEQRPRSIFWESCGNEGSFNLSPERGTRYRCRCDAKRGNWGDSGDLVPRGFSRPGQHHVQRACAPAEAVPLEPTRHHTKRLEGNRTVAKPEPVGTGSGSHPGVVRALEQRLGNPPRANATSHPPYGSEPPGASIQIVKKTSPPIGARLHAGCVSRAGTAPSPPIRFRRSRRTGDTTPLRRGLAAGCRPCRTRRRTGCGPRRAAPRWTRSGRPRG